MKLGEILLQLGMLTPEQLDEALRERSPLGGKLGTRLVERGLLTLDQVSEALGRQMGVPAALQRHFDRADPAIVAMLKPNLAARYLAVPLVAARGGPKRIVVAMATPLDVLAVDDVSFALGARVEPMVAAELAIARSLKRFHNIDLKLERPATHDAVDTTASAPGSREIPVPATMSAASNRQTFSSMAAMTTEPARTLAAPSSVAVSLEDAIHRLSVAEHREQLADILIDFMQPRFGCGLVLLLRGVNAHVWRGFSPGVEARAIETIAFPMAMPSMFRTAKERVATFRGPPPAEGMHLQSQIWKYLHCQVPTDVVVIPIAIRNRIINLVYAHGRDSRGLPDAFVHELQAVCAAIASSFVRLIRQAKEGQQASFPPPR
jgi:hypothetical protein